MRKDDKEVSGSRTRKVCRSWVLEGLTSPCNCLRDPPLSLIILWKLTFSGSFDINIYSTKLLNMYSFQCLSAWLIGWSPLPTVTRWLWGSVLSLSVLSQKLTGSPGLCFSAVAAQISWLPFLITLLQIGLTFSPVSHCVHLASVQPWVSPTCTSSALALMQCGVAGNNDTADPSVHAEFTIMVLIQLHSLIKPDVLKNVFLNMNVFLKNVFLKNVLPNFIGDFCMSAHEWA